MINQCGVTLVFTALIYKKMKCDKNCAKCGYCKDLYTTIQNEFV